MYIGKMISVLIILPLIHAFIVTKINSWKLFFKTLRQIDAFILVKLMTSFNLLIIITDKKESINNFAP